MNAGDPRVRVKRKRPPKLGYYMNMYGRLRPLLRRAENTLLRGSGPKTLFCAEAGRKHSSARKSVIRAAFEIPCNNRYYGPTAGSESADLIDALMMSALHV